MRYLPYSVASSEPNVIVDGTANDRTFITLSHWRQRGTPADLMADRSHRPGSVEQEVAAGDERHHAWCRGRPERPAGSAGTGGAPHHVVNVWSESGDSGTLP